MGFNATLLDSKYRRCLAPRAWTAAVTFFDRHRPARLTDLSFYCWSWLADQKNGRDSSGREDDWGSETLCRPGGW
jgi:hypothetical protein